MYPTNNKYSSSSKTLTIDSLFINDNISFFNVPLTNPVNINNNLTSVVSSLQTLGLAEKITIYEQDGGQLIGNIPVGSTVEETSQGWSVSVSSDGNTIAIGGIGPLLSGDTSGGAWVFIKINNVWTQQGNVILGLKRVSGVAISGNGNTLAITVENSPVLDRGLYVYTRSGTTWSLQQQLLIGERLNCVAISLDGNTIGVCKSLVSSSPYFLKIYTRTGVSWTEQASLVGTGIFSPISVAMSQDGNTVMVGDGYEDQVWVFVRSGILWSEQAGPFAPNNMTGSLSYDGTFGRSCSLSADGNTAIIGRPRNDNKTGAAWIFTRSGTTWSQAFGPIIGTGYEMNNPRIGSGVSMSADGTTAVIGGDGDFVFNFDGETSGQFWIFEKIGIQWLQKGLRLIGSNTYTGAMSQGFSVSMSADKSIIAVGGPSTKSYTGSTWVFKHV